MKRLQRAALAGALALAVAGLGAFGYVRWHYAHCDGLVVRMDSTTGTVRTEIWNRWQRDCLNPYLD